MNNLPPKAPEPYVSDETFAGLFKPDKPRFKYGLGKGCSVIIGTMIKAKNLKIANYKSKD